VTAGANGTGPQAKRASTSAAALAAAGDPEAARDIGALDSVVSAVDRKLAPTRRSLVERLIYGPAPDHEELQAGGRACRELERELHPALSAALDCLASGNAFTQEGKISTALRAAAARAGAYGLTVPKEFGGRAESYLYLAQLEEALAANGLGPLAVEISGQLTIGAGSLLGYGSDAQRKHFLPMVAEGTLMAFALTEVGTGVNAKNIQAYVEREPGGDYRFFAEGGSNKLWITSATYGSVVGVVARIGKGGAELGLFITQLPDSDVAAAEAGWEFSCRPSGVGAFLANVNSRLHFRNYPIQAADRIPGDGVEVLFYCLRLGRCMLAAMSAGYQRMLARDASNYAIQRPGVGGLVIKHELPQLAIGRMLGGSLQSRALSFLALSQDAAGVDLSGLRDLTKSAASQTGAESMVACEHVLGGRAFALRSRVNSARANLHLFGVVEGEDDLIRMSLVRDVTTRFVERHLSGLLDILKATNTGPDGKSVPPGQRILRLGLREFARFPGRTLLALGRVMLTPGTWRLGAWIATNAALDMGLLALRLLPASVRSGPRRLPPPLRTHVRFAERELRALRWTYLRISLVFQLELTGAQMAMQRLGQRIEWLVSMLALCHHAAVQDASQQHVAKLQCLLLEERVRASARGLRSSGLRKLRAAVQEVGRDVVDGRASLFKGLPAEPFDHPWA
jgi:alkylation response protein AidB-like acyl-CoA dehydrogenase